MKKVLVVEDDRKIAMSLGILLKAWGYEVSMAFDGWQAVGMAGKTIPDAIVLDITMPAGDGFSVARRVQEFPATAGTPIIFLTASRRPGLKDQADLAGAFGYLEKPFRHEELRELVDKAVGARSAPAV